MKCFIHVVVVTPLLGALFVSCRPTGRNASSCFIPHKEFHTISQQMSKRGEPASGKLDKPGEAAAVFDANLDGLEDIVIVNGTGYYFVFLNTTNAHGQHRFECHRWMIGRENDGLRNISKSLGLHDLNNDGALDLHLCSMGKGTERTAWRPSDAGLYRDGGHSTRLNCRDGTFAYKDFGANGEGSKRGAIFGDFDGDGRFDAYITTSPYYGIWYCGSPAPCQLYPGTVQGRGFGPDILDKMLINAPPGFWKDAHGNGTMNFKGAVIRDFDNDGKPDIATGAMSDVRADPRGTKVSPEDGPGYQGNWLRGLFVFRNVSSPGHIRFKDVSRAAITNAYGRTDQMHVTGVVPADVNADGRLDLIVAGPRGEMLSNSLLHMTDVLRLYRNDSTPGDMRFTDITEAAGLAFINDPDDAKLKEFLKNAKGRTAFIYTGGFQAAAGIDIDNDADVDIVLTACDLGVGNEPNVLRRPRAACWVFLNDGRGNFTALSPSIHGITALAKDFSYGDFNSDGRVDLVLVKPDHNAKTKGGNHVFFNNITNRNHYIKINASSDSNQLGIGTKVTIYAPGTRDILGYDEVRTDFCYRSKRSTTLHFGLGKTRAVDIKMVFRNGRTLIRKGLPGDTEHTLSSPPAFVEGKH